MRCAVALALAALVAEPAVSAAACRHLGPAIVDHTCLHARRGPFADVAASAPPAADANVDPVHTHYRVALVATGAGFHGAVRYTPQRAGEWAFYVEHDVPLRIVGPEGAALTPTLVDAVPGCPHLRRVEVVTLAAQVVYHLELGPTTASTVGLVIEHVDDFVIVQGRDRDGDGFGATDEVVLSACVPDAGYVANDLDCDDTTAAISPRAVETCDSIDDRNCNGSVDDVGAACAAGVGACATTGVGACAGPGANATCDATAATPGVETCDGVDGDCDGVGDLDEIGLCATDRPRCVGDSRGGAACGCEVDADCGEPGSARLCWLDRAAQVCIDGCIEGFGRNGCSAGLRCTSRDPAAPGTCVAERDADGGDSGCGCRSQPSGSAAMVLIALVAIAGVRRRRPVTRRQPRR